MPGFQCEVNNNNLGSRFLLSVLSEVESSVLMDPWIQHSTFSNQNGATNPFHDRSLDGSCLTPCNMVKDELPTMPFRDRVELLNVIKACRKGKDLWKVRRIHSLIMDQNLISKDVHIGTALIITYTKCGVMEKAQEIFDKLPVRDVVSWNSLIAGYVQHGNAEKALYCFEQMQHERISPDLVTFISSLVSCANVGAMGKGQEIHTEITKRGLEKETLIGNGLIDLYIKCGSCTTAKYIFDNLHIWTIVSWNTLITGYTQLAENENVLELFNIMLKGGILPDLVTFLNVFNACSHAGLVDMVETYFEAMINEFYLIPAVEHYNCLVDLFGRAGNIDKAVAMIKKMPLHPGTVLLQTLLASCRWCGNVDIARLAFGNVVSSDNSEDAVYICMYNIYIEAAMQEDANKVELMRARQ